MFHIALLAVGSVSLKNIMKLPLFLNVRFNFDTNERAFFTITVAVPGGRAFILKLNVFGTNVSRHLIEI